MKFKRFSPFAPAAFALGLLFTLALVLPGLRAQDTWAFEPAEDAFSPDAAFDLRSLNEAEAGQSGWVTSNAAGDFLLGNGEPIRFWAVNSYVERSATFAPRPMPGYQSPQRLGRHARWLAKRGVNLVRLHAHINPDADTQDIDEVNQSEVDWIWRATAAFKKEGIYTVVSPYWANTMESDDGRWGTDWEGNHHGLLFFDETLQAAYKEWLRILFTSPTERLDGGTLAQESALALFQLQNEDSLLFWTVDGLADGPKRRLGQRFYQWAVDKYGTIEAALGAWGAGFSDDDDLADERLGLGILWYLTGDGKAAVGTPPRLNDQLQFFVETMMAFNEEIRRFVREELDCPVLVNAGNWKTADVVLLEDSERYSYSASSDVVALNRYFSGVHEGPNRGWAIGAGDGFTNPSVLKDAALSLPVSAKQPAGKPTMVTESSWVMPMDTAFEGPMLISAYSSLSGFDAYFWFAAGTEGFVPPRSANGYLGSQEKWICLTPETAGQWPAAALAFRRGDIRQAEPVVEEHRSLSALWERRSPIIAESASFDPNRDSGDLPPDSSLQGGVDPLAFLVGPVSVTYDSSESNSSVREDLESYIVESDAGRRVSSATGELILDTAQQRFTVDAPRVQSLIAYQPGEVALSSARFESQRGGFAITAISLDDRPLSASAKILVQMATRSRPAGWVDEAAEIELFEGVVSGREVVSYGSAPWAMEPGEMRVTLKNGRLVEAHALDANGMPVEPVALTIESGQSSFDFPAGTLYVLLEGEAGILYGDWAEEAFLDSEADDAASADPERDGVANVLEFAVDGDPLRPDPAGAGVARLGRGADGLELLLRFRRSLLAAGIEDSFEVSGDLASWLPLSSLTEAAATELLHGDIDGDGSAELLQLRIPLLLDGEGLFLRRRVSLEGEEG